MCVCFTFWGYSSRTTFQKIRPARSRQHEVLCICVCVRLSACVSDLLGPRLCAHLRASPCASVCGQGDTGKAPTPGLPINPRVEELIAVPGGGELAELPGGRPCDVSGRKRRKRVGKTKKALCGTASSDLWRAPPSAPAIGGGSRTASLTSSANSCSQILLHPRDLGVDAAIPRLRAQGHDKVASSTTRPLGPLARLDGCYDFSQPFVRYLGRPAKTTHNQLLGLWGWTSPSGCSPLTSAQGGKYVAACQFFNTNPLSWREEVQAGAAAGAVRPGAEAAGAKLEAKSDGAAAFKKKPTTKRPPPTWRRPRRARRRLC